MKEFEDGKYKMARGSSHNLWKEEVHEEYELCIVFKEDEENWYGHFVEGMGFIDVCYPKKYTRELTEAEAEKYSVGAFEHSNGLTEKISKDELLNREIKG